MSTLLLALVCLAATFSPRADAVFSEIRHDNFDQLGDGRFFLVVLFYSNDPPGIHAKAVKELTKASESFKTYEEVVFGKVDVKKERKLALRLAVESTPTLVFFPYKKKPTPYFGNMDASTIVQAVTAVRLEGRLFRRIHMNEHLVGKHYTDTHKDDTAVRLIKATEFKMEVLSSKKYILLSLFSDGCEEECDIVDMVSKVFRNEENIAFLKLNVLEADEVASHYHVTSNPTLIWFTPDDKKYGKTYGGLITFHMLVAFINTQTGAERDFDGRIHEEAGRIKIIDDFLGENILKLITGRQLRYISSRLNELVSEVRAPKRFLDYYVKIVEKVAQGRTLDQILEEENNYITKRLLAKRISQAERDEWTRFRNIVSVIVDMAAERLMDDRSSSPARMAEEMLYQHQRDAGGREGMQKAQWVRHSHDEL